MLHPCIYYTKKLIREQHKERGVVLFCDLHGHSRRKNIFIYGCNKVEEPEATRIFPFMLSKMNPHFVFEYSKFGVQKSREATARIAIWKELQIPCVYTMEASFCGNDRVNKK